MLDDFAGHMFWPAVRAMVANAGIEPISDGEPEDEIWRKVFAAMAAVGNPLSLGQTPGEIVKQVYAQSIGAVVTPPGGGGSNPPSVILPTPAFGSNAVLWYNAARTYKDYAGNDVSGFIYDTFVANTVSAIQDLMGNGFYVRQADKSLQPQKGASGGAVTAAAGQRLVFEKLDIINGLSKMALWMRVKPRSDLPVSGSSRSLLTISEAAVTSSPAGSGGSAVRFSAALTGGTTGRKLFINATAADGTAKQTSTTLGPQLNNDAHNTIGIELDWTGATAKADFYCNSLTPFYTETWTPAEAAPWAFNTSNTVNAYIGESLILTAPSFCEISGLIIKPNIDASGTERAAMKADLELIV